MWARLLLLVFALTFSGCSSVHPAPLYEDYYSGRQSHLRPNEPTARYLNEILFQRIKLAPLEYFGDIIEGVASRLNKEVAAPLDEARTYKTNVYTISEDFSCNKDFTDIYFAITIKF